MTTSKTPLPSIQAPGAVAVLICREGRFVAIRARQRAGRVGFVAGHIDAGESLEAAAIREAAEESGLVVSRIRILGQRLAGTLVCALVVAEEWSGEIRSSDEGECFWATPAELLDEGSAYPAWNAWALAQLDASRPA